MLNLKIKKKYLSISAIISEYFFVYHQSEIVFGKDHLCEQVFFNNKDLFEVSMKQLSFNTILEVDHMFSYFLFKLVSFPEYCFILAFQSKFIPKQTIRKKGIQLCQSIAYLMSEEELSINEQEYSLQMLVDEKEVYSSVQINLESEKYHHTYEMEKKLLYSIVSGDSEAVIQHFSMFTKSYEGILCKANPLRHEKNICISLVTLCTRAAIEGGFFFEEAYAHSDWWIQKIEEVSSIEEMLYLNLRKAIIMNFIEKVAAAKRKHLSKPSIAIQDYVYSHIYEKITLANLASHIGRSSEYLSKIFKKETGNTISYFIQQAKVNEAKKMIQFGSDSLQHISEVLSFYDYSHFSKTFMKIEGISLNQFLKENDFLLKKEKRLLNY